MAAPVYIPTNSGGRFHFLHTLSSLCYYCDILVCFFFFDIVHFLGFHCVVYRHSASQLGTTGFQMLSSRIWPVAPTLGSTQVPWMTPGWGRSYSLVSVAWRCSEHTEYSAYMRAKQNGRPGER